MGLGGGADAETKFYWVVHGIGPMQDVGGCQQGVILAVGGHCYIPWEGMVMFLEEGLQVMQYVALPAMVALALKLWLLGTAHQRPWADAKWVAFVVVFALHNVSELMVLYRHLNASSAEHAVRFYYVCAIMVMVYGLRYVSDLKNIYQAVISNIALGLGAILIILILATDYVVFGVQRFEYLYAAFKGDGFILFQALGVITQALILVFLSYNYWYWSGRDERKSAMNFYNAIALLPLIIFTIMVVVSKGFGLGLNPMMLIPIGSTLFLFISLNGRAKLYQGDLKLAVKPSLKLVAEKQVEYAKIACDHKEIEWSEAMKLIEHSLMYIQKEKVINQANHGISEDRRALAAYARLVEIAKRRLIKDQANDD